MLTNYKTLVIRQHSRKRERRKPDTFTIHLAKKAATCSVRREAQSRKIAALFICCAIWLIVHALGAAAQEPSGRLEEAAPTARPRMRQAPAGSSCLLRPLELGASFEAPEAGSQSAQRDRYDQDADEDDNQDKITSVRSNQQQLGLIRADAFHDKLAQMSLNTSVQAYRPERLVASQSSGPLTQVAFSSICDGWRNSVAPGAQQPPAYWTYDQARGALVAKFIFYNREQYPDIATRVARLTSPIFRPIPAYHSMPDSRYYSSCKASFRTYLTSAAHLEFSLLLVPTSVSSGAPKAQTAQTAAAIQQQQHSHLLKEIIEGRAPRGKLLAEREGESAAWTEHQVVLPHNLGANALYVLEFAAMPTTMSSSAVKQSGYLNGLAIANFSLSPECFGLHVDEAELERIRSLTGVDPFQFDETLFRSSASGQQGGSSSRHQSGPLGSQLVQLAETYKWPIMLGFILVLLVAVCFSQYLLCAQYHQDLARKSSVGTRPLSWSQRLCLSCCCCCLFRCWPAADRRRVYVAGQKDFKAKKLNCHNNSEADKFRDVSAVDQQLDGMRNYLRPLQSALDNLELNENPNYLANGAQCASKYDQWQSASKAINSLLKPYFIDRKRLTLTKPLGKGAFGEVYQGYLICYCSDDNTSTNENELRPSLAAIGARLAATTATTSLNSGEFEEDMESHSVKVAVKTLTDARMSPNDFIREASNMSLVRHRNIVELIGVCFEEEPLYIVMELLQGGNLKNFLLKNRDKGYYQPANNYQQQQQNQGESVWSLNVTNAGNQAGRVRLGMGDLLVFALDIARACDYLQKRQFIHRDLAARNCLLTSSTRATHTYGETPLGGAPPLSATPVSIGAANPSAQLRSSSRVSGAPPSALDVNANHKVELDQVFLDGYQNSSIVAKLADFGMTRDVFSTDYYRMGYKEMPGKFFNPRMTVAECENPN